MKTFLIAVTMFIACSLAGAADPVGQTLSNGTTVQSVSLSTAAAGVTPSIAPVVDTRSNTEKLRDPDPIIRRNAVIYIGAQRNISSFSEIVTMLNDPAVDVRRAAVNALVEINDPRVVSALMDQFKSEKNMTVKMNIVVAYGDMKSTATITALEGLLKDPYAQFRSEAVRSLGKINEPETYAEIIEMLNDEAEGVRMMTADVAGSLKLRAAIPLLIKNISNPVPMVRRSCAQALGNIGDPSAIDALRKIENDSDMSVRTPALEAIEKLKKAQ